VSRLVTVCDACLRASCWHGTFPCDSFLEAGTVVLAATELDLLNFEDKSCYSDERIREMEGTPCLA